MKLPEKVGPQSGYTTLYWDALDASSAKEGNFHYHDQAVGYTVMQLGLYGAKVNKLTSDFAWVMWNDESYGSWQDREPAWHNTDPNGINYGHTKGLLALQLSTKGGFYLQHSAPAFPFNHTASPPYWHFPYSQAIFAQHFLCVSLGASQVEAVASVAKYYYAYVYEANIPAAAKASLPNLVQLAQMNYVNASGSAQLTTLGGKTLTLVGKASSLDGDLYEDFVAAELNSGVHVQSWCCGNDGYCCQPAYCMGAPVVNASGPQKTRKEKTYPYDSLDVQIATFGQYSFAIAANHAKWAVTESGAPTQQTCWGDTNRMSSQRQRGGGAVCFEDAALYNTMTAAATKIDPC